MNYGGFWIRLLAYLVDSVIVFLLIVVLAVALAFLGEAGALLIPAVCIGVPVLYWALMHASARQATIGKALLGLKVSEASGARIGLLRSLAREVCKYISAIPLMIGFILAGLTKRKQALHDFFVNTTVLREGRAHYVVALVIGVFGWIAPIALVVVLGVGLFAGMAGFMGGGMLAAMQEAQKQGAQPPQTRAAPKKAPPPPQVASAPKPVEPTPALAAVALQQPAASGPGKFVGSWANEDPSTMSITRVEIAPAGASLKIQMWGKCSPVDCDWGAVSSPAKDAETGELALTWTRTFSVTHQQITPLPDGKLQVKGRVRYTDNSGRPNRESTDRFVLVSAPGAARTDASAGAAQPAAQSAKPVAIPPAAPVVLAQAPEKPKSAPAKPAAKEPAKPVAKEPAKPMEAEAAKEEKPKPVARKPRAKPAAASPKPAVMATPAAAAPPVVSSPRFNDLATAVLYRDAKAVDDLIAFGKWPDKTDSRGTTPLMLAVTLGDGPIAEALLKAGANPNRPGPGGDTAMSLARERKDAAMVGLLQRHGAR